jgi:hypothetical protein
LFEHLSVHPELERVFNGTMANGSRRVAQAVGLDPGVTQAKRVTDIGGGGLLAALLVQNPQKHGLLYDTESGLRDAESVLSAAGVLDGSEIVSGDFFSWMPDGCDAYPLKHIVHDWTTSGPSPFFGIVGQRCRRVEWCT